MHEEQSYRPTRVSGTMVEKRRSDALCKKMEKNQKSGDF